MDLTNRIAIETLTCPFDHYNQYGYSVSIHTNQEPSWPLFVKDSWWPHASDTVPKNKNNQCCNQYLHKLISIHASSSSSVDTQQRTFHTLLAVCITISIEICISAVTQIQYRQRQAITKASGSGHFGLDSDWHRTSYTNSFERAGKEGICTSLSSRQDDGSNSTQCW